ncbi:hypothetical protein PENANT_c001G11571 [Penicillium antarcticum]|uniref:Uncharacterized protein n=1 Tax=Penicillium antarcticum TaxID=416450 RepID=A0A1V6QMJ2_9EURO|nr:hypothetical protein PENANT_c001G11571 [Penicillium antarcticum]
MRLTTIILALAAVAYAAPTFDKRERENCVVVYLPEFCPTTPNVE